MGKAHPAACRGAFSNGVKTEHGTIKKRALPERVQTLFLYFMDIQTHHRACAVVVTIIFFASIAAAVSAQEVGSEQVNARRAELQRELSKIEAEIEEQRRILETKQRESVSLERDIDILNAQIQKSKLSIRARDLSIQKLSTDIYGKESTIGELTAKLDREKESLAQLLRKTNEIDSSSVIEVALSRQSLSDFFADLDS